MKFPNLPGLGRKSSQRIALYLLKNKERRFIAVNSNYDTEANHNIVKL